MKVSLQVHAWIWLKWTLKVLSLVFGGACAVFYKTMLKSR